MAISTRLAPAHEEPAPAASDSAVSGGDANINPATGLAADYLNHFNEAIMLLELFADMPDCREHFFAWEPKSYGEHFAESKFQHRDIAIAAYEAADPALRTRLETLADTMNGILMATHQVTRQDLSEPSAGAIADLAVRWVKPLVAHAGAVINGSDAGREAAPHAAIAAPMDR